MTVLAVARRPIELKAVSPRMIGGDDGDLVGLEEVGRHAGAVADVVAHVVGDGGRIAGVVLGDAGLDLADQVGAHVGRLGEDAAADPHEQGQQRAAEAEADQDRGGVFWKMSTITVAAEQAEADAEQAGDGAGAERHPERRCHLAVTGGGGACGRSLGRPCSCRGSR